MNFAGSVALADVRGLRMLLVDRSFYAASDPHSGPVSAVLSATLRASLIYKIWKNEKSITLLLMQMWSFQLSCDLSQRVAIIPFV